MIKATKEYVGGYDLQEVKFPQDFFLTGMVYKQIDYGYKLTYFIEDIERIGWRFRYNREPNTYLHYSSPYIQISNMLLSSGGQPDIIESSRLKKSQNIPTLYRKIGKILNKREGALEVLLFLFIEGPQPVEKIFDEIFSENPDQITLIELVNVGLVRLSDDLLKLSKNGNRLVKRIWDELNK